MLNLRCTQQTAVSHKEKSAHHKQKSNLNTHIFANYIL